MPNDPFTILVQAGPLESFDVMRARIERPLGRPAEAEIEAYAPEGVDPNELLGCEARVSFGRTELEHAFAGVVTDVALVASSADADSRGTMVRLHVASRLALLAHERDCRIFQDKNVKEIVSELCESLGIDAGHQSWRIVGSYPKLEYTVQYNESALAFISRLLEKEGIYFHSQAGDEGELIVFEDDSPSADPMAGEPALPFRSGSGLSHAEDAVAAIVQRHRTASGKVVLRDYNFKTPSVDLTVEAEAEAPSGDDGSGNTKAAKKPPPVVPAVDPGLEIYDYPGLYTEAPDGKRLAKVRVEALQAEQAVFEVRGACPRVLSGQTLELRDTEGGLDGEYFVTSVVHDVSRVGSHESVRDAVVQRTVGARSRAVGADAAPGGTYRMSATLIPKAVRFRTPQRTPWPVIDGPQTATIVAPPGSQNEEIHTDQHGRCKVLFHWDRYGKADDKASCWMRVAQPQTSGSMILPRVGWEAIVEFLEGNPDRPIVTGRVYNGRFMPPYALPEGKSRTSLQTASSPGGNGRNEIRFEDKAGSEEIRIQSQKNTTLVTANDKTTSTAVHESKNVAVNSTLDVGGNETIQVSNGYLDTVGGSQSVSVGGNRKVEVNAVYGLTSGGASATTVGGNQFEMDGNPIQALLDLAVQAATEAAQAEAQQQLAKLDAAVSEKVDQVMGPINELQSQVEQVSQGLEAVSNGDLGAAADALSAAAGLPTPSSFASQLGGAGQEASSSGEGGESGGGAEAQGGGVSSALGLDSLARGAIQAGADRLGQAIGASGGGGGGSSEANVAGPDGTVGSNSAADSATGPGHAVNVCSSSHAETVGSIKATIAADGIHTTVKGDRSQSIGAARVELVAGGRTETCNGSKTETELGLVVLSKGAESESVGSSRTTMVGGAVMQKMGGGYAVTAGSKAMFIGAFHKIDASSSIVFKCGASELTIDGSGVNITSPVITITAPKITLTKKTAQG